MLSYGFYNSISGDRVYSAEDFSAFLDGIVFDGVYNAVGNCFLVETTSTQNELRVGSGRAWFNHTWTWNDSEYILEPSYTESGEIINRDVPLPSNTGYRIDAVIIEVNRESRENTIKVITGTEVSISDYQSGVRPVRPKLLGKNADGSKDTSYEGEIFQYALAYIDRPVSSVKTVIETADITNVVGDNSGETPMVSALALAGLPSGGNTGQILAKRSAQSGDVGWFSPHKLPSDKWYLLDGISESQVIAAYRFIGANSEADSLLNVNEGTSYNLSKTGSPTWNAETGWKFYERGQYIDNSSLRSNASSVIVAVFGFTSDDASKYHGGISLGSSRCLLLGANSLTNDCNVLITTKPLINVEDTFKDGYYFNYMSSTPINGVLAGDWTDRSLWYNGAKQSTVKETSNCNFYGARNDETYTMTIGNPKVKVNNNANLGQFYITAAAFYSVALTAQQHLELALKIKAFGGAGV